MRGLISKIGESHAELGAELERLLDGFRFDLIMQHCARQTRQNAGPDTPKESLNE